MQNLEPILIFITVAEMGSFTRAADSLGIQKGRASTAVRKLEEDVGVRLLHRTTRSVQLTEDGRVFHARARDLLAEVDDLHSMFASDRVALRGRLRVDLPTEVARTTVVPALPDFLATHPELELELSSTDRQVDLVQEGFDCVLRLGPCVDGSGLARRIFTLRRWSERPCVRPVCAVHITAGHNALRGSGPGQKHAFEDAMAHVGCPDRRIDRRCIKCCSPSQPLRHTGCPV